MENGFFDNLTESLITFCISVVDLLPDSPFSFIDTLQGPATEIMGMVNWFVDFGSMLTILNAWVVCIFLWYTYQIVLRWIKVIG